MELPNHVLAGWSTNYVHTMQESTQARDARRAAVAAASDAEFLLWNNVAGLGRRFGAELVPDALRMFVGAGLVQSITGVRTQTTPRKRGLEEVGAGQDSEGRRVKARIDDGEMGRGDADVGMSLGGSDGLEPAFHDDVSPQPTNIVIYMIC